MISRYDIFCRVVDAGSFTAAAVQLGYSQSAVSQTVQGLEKELDTTLIRREHGRLSLTKDGTSYLPYFRTLCSAEQALAKKQNEMLGMENCDIRIGTFTSVSRMLLPPLMQQFKKKNPGVSFILRQGDYNNINQWIREGSVDFGFVNSKVSEDLPMQPLFQDDMMAVLPIHHPLAAQPFVSLKQLAREPFILLDEGKYSLPLETFRQHGLQPKIEYTVYDDYSILAMVAQGLGISILYRLVLASYASQLAVRPVQEQLKRTVSLSWQNWHTMPRAARLFAEFIMKHTSEILPEPGAVQTR